MRKIVLLLGIAVAGVLPSGCLSYSRGYCNDADLLTSNANVSQKFPLTYSIEYIQADFVEPCVMGGDNRKLREVVEATLNKTELFSSIQYKQEAPEDSYHATFRFWRSGTDLGTAMGAGYLCGVTFCLIPVGVDTTLDASANLTLRGKNLATFGKAESMRTVFWLPFFPFSLSYFFTPGNVDEKIINALVTDIVEFHVKTYLGEKM